VEAERLEGDAAARYRVLLVEDEEATRQYLADAIVRHPALELQAACADLLSARQALAAGVPDVLVTDLALPDGDGIALVRELKQRAPDCECMVISVFGTERRVLGAIEAGATGYLLKDESNEHIGDAIVSLVRGGSPMSPAIARHLLDRMHAPRPRQPEIALTQREVDVLAGLSKGYTYGELATQMTISAHTVGTHVKNIYRKLEVCSRAEAVFEAVQRGLIKLS
jgi:DNA-binding NarL/FixJ family response regulator